MLSMQNITFLAILRLIFAQKAKIAPPDIDIGLQNKSNFDFGSEIGNKNRSKPG